MANTYLSRTPSSAGNRQTWTWSAWIKRSKLLTDQAFFSAYAHANDSFQAYFTNDDKINMYFYNGTTYNLKPARQFRDVNAWYHIVLAVDNTLASGGDRFKIYVNGVRETVFTASNNPTQNLSMTVNDTTGHYISSDGNSNNPFDGSMSHIHFIDGTAYDASAFGETDATTGEWVGKTSPSVTYGTNGFFILKDGNGITDQSGEGNNFTVAGGTLTDLKDNPDNTFATLNPLANQGTVTFSNGNLSTNQSNNNANASGTLFASKGKYYWECKSTDANTNLAFGIMRDDTQYTNSDIYQVVGTIMYYKANGQIFDNIPTTSGGVSTAYGDSWGNGDIVSCAIDLDNGYLYFAKNGVWQNSGVPTSGATGTGGISIPTGESFTAVLGNGSGSVSASCSMNFGNGYFGTTAVASAGTNASDNGIFEYDVPTGYTALSTKGLNE
jgi:hypothetical protein